MIILLIDGSTNVGTVHLLAFYKIRRVYWQGGDDVEGRDPFVLFIFPFCIKVEAFHIHWTVLFIGGRLCIRAAALRA